MMDHDVDVALWQRGISLQEDQEIGPACYLFEASTSAFSALLQLLAADPVRCGPQSYGSLRDEFRKFYMWHEGFSTRTGDLDNILTCSKNLKGTVLGLMVQWVRTLTKVPGIMSETDWSSVFQKFTELQMLTGKVDQIAKAALSDMKSQYFVVDGLDLEDGSDSDSDLESSFCEYTFDDIIEDLSTYMESLSDLTPSLDHPAIDHVFIEDVNTSLIDEFSTVSEPARPFVSIIRDRFPSLDAGIVKKLGEANWQRRERLRMKLDSTPRMREFSTDDDDNSSIGNTTINNENQQTIVGTVRSSISLTRTFQSATIESQFSEPSIFDHVSISIPAARRASPAESVTSFATSVAEGMNQGQRRVPNLPEEHVYGSSFQCKICGDVLTEIRHRANWKKHVYNDLEPYTCLFSDCNLGQLTFQSRREWKDHEFQVHRVNTEWRCNLCKKTFKTQEPFREHINKGHGNDITMSQVEEFISVSKRLVPCKIENEICPFCLATPSQTQNGFASHVGKHQQEISLAALPRLEDYSDDDESIDNGKGSDGDDGSDDNGDGGSKIKGIDDIEHGSGKRFAPIDTELATFIPDLPEDTRSEEPLKPSIRLPCGHMSYEACSCEGDMDEDLPSNKGNIFQSQIDPHHSHSLSHDIQQSSSTISDPRNRLISSIRDFEKTVGKLEDLWELLPSGYRERFLVLVNLEKEVSLLRRTIADLSFRSFYLDRPSVENSIEALAICQTQLLLLHKVLESVIYRVDEPEKKSRRRKVLRQLFARQQEQEPELDKAKDILDELQARSLVLREINNNRAASSNLSDTKQLSAPIGPLAERAGPQSVLSPTGILHSGSSETARPSLEETKARLEKLKPSFLDDYVKYQSFLNEPTGSTSKAVLDLHHSGDSPQDKETATRLRPRPSSGREDSGSMGNVSADRALMSESSKSELGLDDNDLPNDSDYNEEGEDTDVAYPCKGCGDILEKGEAFELAGNRWHIDCFRCSTCGRLIDSDSNFLLLADASLICNNCIHPSRAFGQNLRRSSSPYRPPGTLRALFLSPKLQAQDRGSPVLELRKVYD